MRRLPALLLVALLACTAQTPVIEPTPTQTSTAEPTPTEQPPPPVKQARGAVFATGEQVLFYDPKTDTLRVLASGSGLDQARFLDRDTIVFIQRGGGFGSPAALIVQDLRTNEQTELITVDDGIEAFAVSPDRRRVAYLSANERGFPRLRIRTLVGDQPTLAVGTLAQVRGRETFADDQVKMTFDHRGNRVLVVYTFADGGEGIPPSRSQLQVRTVDGDLAYGAVHDAFPTMAIWSPDSRHVYFRNNDGTFRVRVNRGTVTAVSGAERWFDPWFSPDGERIVYATAGVDPASRLRVLDLSTGTRSTIGEQGLFRPVFAHENLVWAERAAPCPNEDCFSPGVPTGEIVRINLTNGRTKRLALPTLAGIDVFYAE